MIARKVATCLLASLTAICAHCSSSTSSSSCASLAGKWQVSGCASFQCNVTQSGCSVTIGCPLVSYTGTVSGNTVNFQTFDADGGALQTCQGTVSGTTLAGTCTTAASTCTFSAVQQ